MKYVRTKDGIQGYNNICELSYIYQTMCGINIADTIEELCDEFVYKKEKVALVIDKENPHLSYILVDIDDMTPFYTRRMVYLKDLVEPLYGAIWTDKGLIYVAKMNEKGELELL